MLIKCYCKCVLRETAGCSVIWQYNFTGIREFKTERRFRHTVQHTVCNISVHEIEIFWVTRRSGLLPSRQFRSQAENRARAAVTTSQRNRTGKATQYDDITWLCFFIYSIPLNSDVDSVVSNICPGTNMRRRCGVTKWMINVSLFST